MAQEKEFDPVHFGVGVMKDHESKLFQLIQSTLQQAIINYTDREGNLDRQLVSQQIALRSTLLLNLSNQLGRLQMGLYSLACQRVGVDYGEIMNQLVEATEVFEARMDAVHMTATRQLPLPAAPDIASPAKADDGPEAGDPRDHANN